MVRLSRWLGVLGVAGVVATLSWYHAGYVAVPRYPLAGAGRFGWSVAWVLLLSVASYTVGLPDQPRRPLAAAGWALTAAAAAALAVSVVQLVVGDTLLPRFVVFGSMLATVPLQVALNAMSRGAHRREVGRDRVVVVGAARERARLSEDLHVAPERGSVLVGEVDPGEAGLREALVSLCRSRGATVLVLDREAQADEAVIAQAARLHESGVRVRTLHGFYEAWLGKLPLSELERASLFFDIGEVHRVGYLRTKRLVDTALAAAGAVVLVAALPAVLVGNLVANRGPLLFRQQRVGKGGEPFTILKFRTMRPGEDQDSSSWTDPDDPRVTPFGRVLRRTHLDELPQVLNILRGDLAVVGPRPEQPHYVEELRAKLAFYDLRHLVRPGLTGWAQVKQGYAGDAQDALEKLQYEFFYLRQQDLRFDLRIVVRTLRSVIGSDGR